jgi:hypothetical protein
MSFIKNFQKVTNNNSIFRFLPDNQTIGTEEYYRQKLGDNFPDELYKYLEIKSRVEYTDDDLQFAMEVISNAQREYEKQLLAEFEDRANENNDYDLNSELGKISIENVYEQYNQLSEREFQSDSFTQ